MLIFSILNKAKPILKSKISHNILSILYENIIESIAWYGSLYFFKRVYNYLFNPHENQEDENKETENIKQDSYTYVALSNSTAIIAAFAAIKLNYSQEILLNHKNLKSSYSIKTIISLLGDAALTYNGFSLMDSFIINQIKGAVLFHIFELYDFIKSINSRTALDELYPEIKILLENQEKIILDKYPVLKTAESPLIMLFKYLNIMTTDHQMKQIFLEFDTLLKQLISAPVGQHNDIKIQIQCLASQMKETSLKILKEQFVNVIKDTQALEIILNTLNDQIEQMDFKNILHQQLLTAHKAFETDVFGINSSDLLKQTLLEFISPHINYAISWYLAHHLQKCGLLTISSLSSGLISKYLNPNTDKDQLMNLLNQQAIQQTVQFVIPTTTSLTPPSNIAQDFIRYASEFCCYYYKSAWPYIFNNRLCTGIKHLISTQINTNIPILATSRTTTFFTNAATTVKTLSASALVAAGGVSATTILVCSATVTAVAILGYVGYNYYWNPDVTQNNTLSAIPAKKNKL